MSATSIPIALLTFGILVAIHEWGHFWVARRCGVKVLRFAIGFGPVLFSWRDKQDTEYAICALPLGGYVKMLDEAEGSVDQSEKHLAFNNKHPWRRIAIASAGPIANFMLAIVAFFIIFVTGTRGVAPIVGEVEANSPAAMATVMAGDELVEIDGRAVQSWQDVMQVLMLRLGETGTVDIRVKREDQTLALSAPINRWLAGTEEPDLITDFGFNVYQPHVAPIISEVISDSAAEGAGLLAGDEIVSANGEQIVDWYHWVKLVQASPDTSLLLSVIRDGQQTLIQMTPSSKLVDGETIGLAGVAVVPPKYPEEYLRSFQYSLPVAFVKALNKTWDFSVFTLESFGKLLTGLISPKNLSGPITIAKVASDSAEHGLEAYLSILAMLSISLGVLNLLPIPVLDGGHIVFHSIEWLKGSPVSEKIQELSLRVGVSLVLCLMVFAIFNDISRL